MTPSAPGSAPADPAGEVSAALKVLGEPRRLRVLRVLLEAPDTLCGCELSDILEVPDYQISRDLAALRAAGLVRDRGRSGTWVHYEAVEDAPDHLARVLELVRDTPLAPDDARRFELRYGMREQVGCVLGPGHPDVAAAFAAAGLEAQGV
jgi:DNA-binding transcriptional ArsR family regulator